MDETLLPPFGFVSFCNVTAVSITTYQVFWFNRSRDPWLTFIGKKFASAAAILFPWFLHLRQTGMCITKRFAYLHLASTNVDIPTYAIVRNNLVHLACMKQLLWQTLPKCLIIVVIQFIFFQCQCCRYLARAVPCPSESWIYSLKSL